MNGAEGLHDFDFDAIWIRALEVVVLELNYGPDVEVGAFAGIEYLGDALAPVVPTAPVGRGVALEEVAGEVLGEVEHQGGETFRARRDR